MTITKIFLARLSISYLIDNQAEDTLRKCSESLEEYNRAADRGYDISFAYGIAQFEPEKPTTVEELLAEGDAPMLEIKLASN